MALRLSRKQHSLSMDLTAAQQSSTISSADRLSPDIPDDANETQAFVDELDEPPPAIDDSYYGDGFEDI